MEKVIFSNDRTKTLEATEPTTGTVEDSIKVTSHAKSGDDGIRHHISAYG